MKWVDNLVILKKRILSEKEPLTDLIFRKMLNQNDLCTWCCKMSSEYIPPSPILTHLQKKLQIFTRHFGKVIVVKYVSKFNLISLIATSHGFFTLCELKMLFSKLLQTWMSIIPL